MESDIAKTVRVNNSNVFLWLLFSWYRSIGILIECNKYSGRCVSMQYQTFSLIFIDRFLRLSGDCCAFWNSTVLQLPILWKWSFYHWGHTWTIIQTTQFQVKYHCFVVMMNRNRLANQKASQPFNRNGMLFRLCVRLSIIISLSFFSCCE